MIRTSKRIKTTVSALQDSQRIEVLFKPITDKVWLDGDGAIVDASGVQIDAGILGKIAHRKTCAGRVVCGDSVRLHDERTSEYIDLTAAHVEAIRVLPGPTTVKVDGLRYDLVLHPEGHAVVGCQTITEAGCLQAFKALAEHLGYELS